jgi:predicted membrane-bound mannosyltransferase
MVYGIMERIHSQKRNHLYLSGILILGAAVRLFKLGSQSFWWDEVYSATLSAKSLATVARINIPDR